MSTASIDEEVQRRLVEAEMMRQLLLEYVNPVMPYPFTSTAEWKIDFDAGVKCLLYKTWGTA